MKIAITLVLISSALLFVPTMFVEQFEQPKTWILEIFALCSIGILDWRYLRRDKIAFLLGLFTVSAAISTAISIDPHMSFYGNWHAPLGLLSIFSYLVFYLACKKSQWQFFSYYSYKQVFHTLIGTAFVVATYACLQAFGVDFMRWSGTLSMAGFTRPSSTIGHPNFTAGYLVMVLPFVMHRIENGHQIEKILMILVASLMSCVILLCQSRGMWIAAACMTGTYFMWSDAPRKTVVASAIALGLIFSASLMVGPKGYRESVLNRMGSIADPGDARHEYPAAAVRIWKKYPIFGAGTDAFETAFQHQRTAHYWEIEKAGSPHRAHCDMLNILACQGLLGFCIAFGLFVAVASKLQNSIHPARAAIAACLAAFFIEGLSSFVVIPLGTLAIFCLAIL
jgi:hypothetical protein